MKFSWVLIGALLCFAFLAVFIFPLPYQNISNISPNPIIKSTKEYKKKDFITSLDSLKRLYGENKKLPKGFELQALLALSHFPELKSSTIHFIVEEAYLPLASRPDWKSMLFKGKKDWVYNVIISNKSSNDLEDVLLSKMPFNSQIGIVGHELSHTAYYLDKSFFEIILIGVNFLYPEYRIVFENDTDIRTIYHGLGWQLLDHAIFTRETLQGEALLWLNKYYLKPEEIKAIMDRLTDPIIK